MRDMDFVYDIEDFDGRVIDEPKRLDGIGGWLIFPVYGWLGLTSLSLLFSMATAEDVAMRLGSLILFFMLCIPGTLAANKSRHFPKAWVLTFWSIYVLGFVFSVNEQTTPEVGGLVGESFWLIVWTVYMFTSKRVRNTFTR